MNNIVLDVAIGLVFIYLLYSLLATTINEFVAMIFAYRHRMLEKAIEQMLDGKNYSYYWWDKLGNVIRWFFFRNKEKRYKAGKSPETKLSRNDFFRNVRINDMDPFAYEAAKKYDANLKDAIKKNRKLKNEIKEYNSQRDEKAKNEMLKNKMPEYKNLIDNRFIEENTISKSKSNKNYINRSKLNKKSWLFASNIINHPLYRRKSEQSLLFKKPAYLSASAFSDILFDVLSGRRTETNSLPILMNDIKSFVNDDSKFVNNKDLKSILNVYIEQANGDVQKFKLLLEDWFDDSMNRVTGWYKRQATKVLFIIGLALAFAFNVSTIEIAHKLSTNKDLREAMTQSASNYVEQKNKQINTASRDKPDTSLESAEKQIKDIQKLYNDTIADVNMMMGLGWKFPDEYLDKSYWLVPACLEKSFNKVIYVINESFSHPRNWIGFLITALAITLGAPFWFDLLSKFVNLRSGGNKPPDSDSKQLTISKTVSLNQKPDPSAKG
ncbi:MAG: hypothetical protein QM802_14000 [Agriterribacter sp.]